ncbi:YceI family protein [Tautonia sociabilis]|uniref:YceI family protein n=1 Tax=Tautonia sociabilis TaxID=2080755 RepID=A0A432MEX9_9BACT|nr:YceI family protein [Tautonia sociabilis]RUL84230.1 YceI family protein [Tautonia sociabilis]
MNVIARWSAMLALAVLMIAGCSDPTADVTAAKVGEAQPVADSDPVAALSVTEFEADADANANAEPDLQGAAEPESEPAVAAEGGESVLFDGSNSSIGFFGSKLVGGGHDGGFKTFSGRFVLNPEGEVVSVSATIDMNSLWSDNDQLTGHLKNEDFFEVNTYPESEFVSTSITPASAGAEGATHEVTGNLTMHGVTKSVTFPATVAVTDSAVTLDSEFKIDRTIWGIVYGADSDVRDRIINKDVVIRLDIDAPRGSSAAE